MVHRAVMVEWELLMALKGLPQLPVELVVCHTDVSLALDLRETGEQQRRWGRSLQWVWGIRGNLQSIRACFVLVAMWLQMYLKIVGGHH